MRTLLAVACLALLTVAFAGCAEDKERYPDGVPTTSASRSQTTATGTGSSTGTSTGPDGNGTGNGTNEPPLLSLTAAANGTSVTFNLTGSDPEGQPLNWTLTFGDGNQTNGTSLPETLTHNYTAPGNYSVNFTVSDGESSSSHEAALELTGGGAPGSSALVDVTKTWTASLTGGYEYALGCDSDGLDCAYFPLPAAAQGQPFTFTFTATVPAALYYVDLYSGGEYIATFGDPTFSDPIPGGPGPVVFSDVVPAGIDEFRSYASGGAVFSAHLLIA